ncbi:Hypothetical_protein [Hexamita inflata]|uniref:Hypothetical_protein n=1 Tax=Hexamita inflata TaxID=28002 RepID=A0AA86Q3L1_9EUKA|nr:Hypothetical protein HINF_LOCUS33400 [Hexamita inflata]
MRLGQIGCGRQNAPIQSAELASSRIYMAKGMPSTIFRIGKRQPFHCFIRNADGTTQVDPRIDQLARSRRIVARWLPWLRRCAQRTQVCLEDRTSINERQVSGIYIIQFDF